MYALYYMKRKGINLPRLDRLKIPKYNPKHRTFDYYHDPEYDDPYQSDLTVMQFFERPFDPIHDSLPLSEGRDANPDLQYLTYFKPSLENMWKNKRTREDLWGRERLNYLMDRQLNHHGKEELRSLDHLERVRNFIPTYPRRPFA